MKHFDLVIVGAGIVGACVAYLSRMRHPTWKVLIVDRSFVGDGVTRYSGGLNHPYGWSESQALLSKESLDLFDEIRRHIPHFPLFDAPIFGIACASSVDGVLSRFTRPGAHIGTPADVLDLKRTYPTLVIPVDSVVITGSAGGYGNPKKAVEILVRWFEKQQRGEVWEGIEITGISPGPHPHRLRTSDGRTLLAEHVIVAAGPWLPHGLGRDALRHHNVRIKKIVSFHLDRPPKHSDAVLFFLDDDSYLLPNVSQESFIFSFPSREWDATPEISQLRISSFDRELATATLRKYCPSLEDRLTGGRVFCDAYTPDRLPVICNAPDSARFVVAGGCSGFGFRLAPAIARRALDAATRDEL